MAKIKSVRGMNDIPPEQVLAWSYAEEIISRTFLKKSSINHKFLNFAKSLKNDGHTIGILSNLTPETSTCVEKNLLKDFDYHFFSNSLRLSKPNPEIYRHVCKKLPSKNILFIDDKQENLDAAKLFGSEEIFDTHQLVKS